LLAVAVELDIAGGTFNGKDPNHRS